MKSKTSKKPQITVKQDNLPNYAPKGISIEDILYYKSKNLTHEEIANLTGCTHSNITQRLKEIDLQGLENFKEHKDKVFEHRQREILSKITDEDYKKAGLSQKILGIGILQDKIQALRGQATDIYEVRSITTTLQEATERMRQAGLLRDDLEPLDVTNSLNEVNV